MHVDPSGGRETPITAIIGLLLKARSHLHAVAGLFRPQCSSRVAHVSWPRWAIGALALLVALQLFSDAMLAPLRVPFDHSEGWNAFNTNAAMAGHGLYPDTSSLWFNNYPPLSFWLVGEFGRLFDDYIVVERYIALMSAVVAAGFVAATARGMKCTRAESLAAAVLFLASPWVSAKFAGIADPQMLGHALGCAGFAVVVGAPKNTVALVFGALLLTLALFVKPIFIVQPLALLLWLTLAEPASALLLGALGACFCGLGVCAANAGLGVDLLKHLLFARAYSLSRMFSHPGQWLITGIVPLVTTISLLAVKRDHSALLCGIYAVVAMAFSLFFCGGEGVGGNPTIDLSIATSLGLMVFANRCRARMTSYMVESRPEIAIGAAALCLFAALAASMAFGWDSGSTIRERFGERSISADDIDLIRRTPGTGLCETASLCYWGGKREEVDVWGMSQALKTHTRNEAELVRALSSKRYGVIQLERRSSFFQFREVRATLESNYRLYHVDPLGSFFVRR